MSTPDRFFNLYLSLRGFLLILIVAVADYYNLYLVDNSERTIINELVSSLFKAVPRFAKPGWGS